MSAILFPTLLPNVLAWGHRLAQQIEDQGEPLAPHWQSIARQVGVREVQRIRLLKVSALPLPDDMALVNAVRHYGLFGPGAVGLTLGYGIVLAGAGANSPRILSHEFRHVHQFEQAGSLEAFIGQYVAQLAQHGYRNAPYEIDARHHEVGQSD